MSRLRFLLALVIILALSTVLFSLLTSSSSIQQADDRAGSPPILEAQKVVRSPQESWLHLPEMPHPATQADIGAVVYRLVCVSCHGDRGQGMTAEYRATWNPQDQDCWQSKCHSDNHPPDGFGLPRYIGGVVGPGSLDHFATAADLYEYNRVEMPWHNPGSLTEEENWQLTAFLLRENGIDLKGLPLDEARAQSLLLNPVSNGG